MGEMAGRKIKMDSGLRRNDEQEKGAEFRLAPE
jgi:hypothetical protein